MKQRGDKPTRAATLAGRCFVNPLFDYMLIGGGLSLIVVAMIVMSEPGDLLLGPGPMLYIVLLSNGAHFAASTVRLYTKPGSARLLPFLSKAVPGIAIILMTLCLVYVGRIGGILETFYLTWSPYHYAAQAYGLAVMYSYRSGCALKAIDKRLLWWVSMIPFFYMAVHLFGLRLPEPALQNLPALADGFETLKNGLIAIGVAAPLLLFMKVWRNASGPMPLISLLTLVTNAIWFFVLDPLHAFLWATVFHGIQYLAIVIIFDVGDQRTRLGNGHGWVRRASWFYALCLGFGCVLFLALPRAYAVMGFDYEDSRLVSIAVINIHHFIVDAYIWRLGKRDSNRRIVEEAY